MAKKRLTTVKLVIARFAAADIGIRKLGRLLGGSDFMVAHWQARSDLVPSKHNTGVLALAKKEGVKLSIEELVNGGAL